MHILLSQTCTNILCDWSPGLPSIHLQAIFAARPDWRMRTSWKSSAERSSESGRRPMARWEENLVGSPNSIVRIKAQNTVYFFILFSRNWARGFHITFLRAIWGNKFKFLYKRISPVFKVHQSSQLLIFQGLHE